jgi:glutamate carboxypeptidase
MRILIAAAAAFLLAGAAVAAPAATPRDEKGWAAAERLRPEQMRLLEELVNIDSGTFDVPGGEKVGEVLRRRLRALGMTVESVPAEAPGLPDNLVARLGGLGRGRILMIAHLDTVFEPGTAAKRPFRTDATRAYGPGVGDEKGGIVQAIYALSILRDLGFAEFKEIVLLIETSEERGSPGTRALISKLLAEADVELNLEPGDAPDKLTVWRKGSATYHIDVKGRPAHAGVAPQEGRNAAVELINQIRKADVFPRSGDGLTANLTIMHAGARNNIIPEDATAAITVRARTKADFAKDEQTLRKNAEKTQVPDTKVTIRLEPSFPPLLTNPATEALADRAAAIYAGLGLNLGRGGNGGASESALAADAGVPALDGLGPVGGKFHSEDEYIELKSVTPRLYLLTKLIMDLAVNPPARMAP